MAYITLENVVKRYRMGEVTITAVDNITFDINKGEFVIIVGPSGAGKTTVLNILGGMDACDGGTISVDGELVSGAASPPTAATISALSFSSITWFRISPPWKMWSWRPKSAKIPLCPGRS